MSILEVEGLCKTYPAFRLRDVSFAVEPGAIMGFIGRNGAGKSTTIKTMLNLVHPDGGRVTMFGRDFYADEPACKQQLGVVLGGVDFYPNRKLGVITDVTRRFYAGWDEEKYRHYLSLFALDETKKVSQLSSGMRVKYMLALALSHDARLLILDEPTSGLDPVSRDELMELFQKERFTRIPVYEENTDNVIGIVNMKDFILFDHEKEKNFSIRDYLRQPLYTYEYKKTAELMLEMRTAAEKYSPFPNSPLFTC